MSYVARATEVGALLSLVGRTGNDRSPPVADILTDLYQRLTPIVAAGVILPD